jgi:hypothetical protein
MRSAASSPISPSTNGATLFRGATVLTMDADDQLLSDTDVLVEDGAITALGTQLNEPSGTRVIDASRHLLMPGLINGHVHSPANFLKGALDDAPLEMFMLYEVPPLAASPETARLCRLRTLLGAAEMLKLGITAVHDDAFFNPVPTIENVDAVMQAYSDSGMRASVSLDQPNVIEFEKYPFLKELLPADLRNHMECAPRQSDSEMHWRCVSPCDSQRCQSARPHGHWPHCCRCESRSGVGRPNRLEHAPATRSPEKPDLFCSGSTGSRRLDRRAAGRVCRQGDADRC